LHPGGRVTRDVEEAKGSPGTARDKIERRPSPVWSRASLRGLTELFVLTGFVITQPVLEVTGKSPDFFLFLRADRLDIVALVLGVMLLPALGIWAGEILVGLINGRIQRHVHLAAVVGMFMLLAVEVAKKITDVRRTPLLAIAVVSGLVGGVVYARTSWLRLWLRYLTPAPVVFALVFLLFSPTSALVRPAPAEASASRATTPNGGQHPPLVVILFDEFPLKSLLDSRGRIDKRVYPNFARLAGQSTWYRNATGVAGYTPWAMPAMLTSRYPAKVKAPSYTEYPDNMLTLFGRYYDLQAYETISQLCPPSQCPPTAGNLDRVGLRAVLADSARVFRQIVQPDDAIFDPAFFADQAGPGAAPTLRSREEAAAVQFRFNRLDSNQPSRFNDFLAGLKNTGRPRMHFLHLLLPHQPWRYQPTGNEYNFKTVGMYFKSDETPAPVVELDHERHLLQLAYTDRLVGQVIDKLKAQGMWDKSLVVMGADHGQGWVPGEQRRILDRTNASDLMWVPMIIKAPGQDKAVVDDRNWEQVDLLPTVADLAGIQVPWRMEGASQTGKPTRTRTEKWWYDVPGRRKVRDGPSNWRIVLQGDTDTVVWGSDGVRGLYRFGAFADLVYRDPGSVGPIAVERRVTAVLDDYLSYETIGPHSGTVPALVSGKLTSPLALAADTVLVAVNGKLAGGSRLFPERPGDPAANFAVITPDTLWKAGDGRRQLQVYVLDRSGGGPRLLPVSLSEG
jgi:hypothetical protein